jgi:hypothetical protein
MGVKVRPVVIDERALLTVAASLTDDAVKVQLEKHLPPHVPALKSWLVDALKVQPADRYSAKCLKDRHSHFLRPSRLRDPVVT